MPSGPLVGIRVLEFTQVIAGPFACQNLADMGAEVIKVEPPEGEPWRQFAQFMPGEAKYFQSLNRGKKSLVLSLQKPEAQAVVHKLMPSIDAVVVNYRPDVPKRLGIDYETLSALRPNLIYVDNTAFGRRGPWAHRPGYDVVVQAASGLMAAEGKIAGDGPDVIRSVPIADYGTGVTIAWGVCAALYHRERTGQGQFIQSTLLKTALAFQGSVAFDLPIADERVHMRMDRVHEAQARGATYPELAEAYKPITGGNIYYRAYATADGALSVGALSPSLWAKVRKAIGTDYLGMQDPEFNPFDPAWLKKSEEAVADVEAKLRSKKTAEWMEIFDREGVPASPVNFTEDLINDPQVLANEMMVDLDHDLSGPQRQVGPLLDFSVTPLEAQGASPPIDRDTDAVLLAAGYTAAQVADLRAQGVVGIPG